MSGSVRHSVQSNFSIISIVCFNFASYVCNGLPLAVLPGYVLNVLGFNSIMAGIIIGTQYLATLLSRPLAGTLADKRGPKQTVMFGLTGLVASGALTALAIFCHGQPVLSLSLLLAGRILQGVASAMVSTPACAWAIGLLGAPQTARIMSWNGIAAYGGTAAGAPLGVLISYHFGLSGIGFSIMLLSVTALLCAQAKRAAPLVSGVRLPFKDVFFAMLPNGLVMACSSAGFGSLTAFIALYFDSLGWAHAAYCLTGFGLAFIFARLVSPNVIPRFGGYPVVTVCLLIQSLGLFLIWMAPSPELVITGACLTGLGVSWVYPGLAVETLARTPAANRSSALSALSLFFDLAVGMAGPIMGLIAAASGYAEVFFCCGFLASIGFALVLVLKRRSANVNSSSIV